MTSKVICLQCGCDLRELPDGLCPECGAQQDGTLVDHPAVRRLLRIAFAPGWWAQVRAVGRLALWPASVVRATPLALWRTPRLVRRLVGYAVVWHIVLMCGIAGAGACVGVAMGVWRVHSEAEVERYFALFYSTSLFSLLYWGVLSIIVGKLLCSRHAVDGLERPWVAMVGVCFVASVLADGIRRVFVMAWSAAEVVAGAVDLWSWQASSIAGYAAFGLSIWLSLHPFALRRQALIWGGVSAVCALGGMCAERWLFGAWCINIEYPLFRVLGV